MTRENVIKEVKTYVKSADGYHFIIEAKDFLKVLKLEETHQQDVIKFNPHLSAQIRSKLKGRLSAIVNNILDQHKNLYVIMKKQPNENGVFDSFLFDGYIFNNITPVKIEKLRTSLSEKNKGLWVPYDLAHTLLKRPVVPYYSKLVPLGSPNEKLGMWVLRKYYTAKP